MGKATFRGEGMSKPRVLRTWAAVSGRGEVRSKLVGRSTVGARARSKEGAGRQDFFARKALFETTVHAKMPYGDWASCSSPARFLGIVSSSLSLFDFDAPTHLSTQPLKPSTLRVHPSLLIC